MNTTPTTAQDIQQRIANFRAAANKLNAVLIPAPEACGLCQNEVPTDPDGLKAWTARQLAEDVRWQISADTPAVTLSAGMFAVCPPCEVMIIERDAVSFVDDDLQNLLALGMPASASSFVRSELATFYATFLNAIGEPRPLAEVLA